MIMYQNRGLVSLLGQKGCSLFKSMDQIFCTVFNYVNIFVRTDQTPYVQRMLVTGTCTHTVEGQSVQHNRFILPTH